MPTIQRLLTDDTGQALVTAINNVVAAVKPNATEIQMSSSDTTTVATEITNINNKIGTVPSGQTVEGQITTLNSNIANLFTVSSKSDTKSAASGTSVYISDTMGKTGRAIFLCEVDFASNATGKRQAAIRRTGTGGWGEVWLIGIPAVSGDNTRIAFPYYLDVTQGDSYDLVAAQNSGSSISTKLKMTTIIF